ncbi:MAG: hypothetical protein WAW61_22225 [Methylococcaceae bacterium]
MRVLVLLALLTGCTEIQCRPTLSPIFVGVSAGARPKPDGLIIVYNCSIMSTL